MKRKNKICTLGLSHWTSITPIRAGRTAGPTQKRLADAFACLANIERQRAQGHDPLLGKFVEDRIVWRELLELELQDVEEQIDGITAAVERASNSRDLRDLKDERYG